MNTKLTLSIPADVTMYAKEYAESMHISLSKLITDYLRGLKQESQKKTKPTWESLDPFTKLLAGSLKGSGINEKNYKKHLEDRA